MSNSSFITLPILLGEAQHPVDHHYQITYILYARDYMEKGVPIPGKCVVVVTGLGRELIVDCEVTQFIKHGFVPIVYKEDQSLRKSYLNPLNIKSVRVFLDSKPQKWMIVMSGINPVSPDKKPYTFITTDDVTKWLPITPRQNGLST